MTVADEPPVKSQAHGVVGADFRQRQAAVPGDLLQLPFEIATGAAVEHQHQQPGRVMPLFQQVANAPGQGEGFATARHRGYHRMLVRRSDDVTLFVGQVVGQVQRHGAIVIGNWHRGKPSTIIGALFYPDLPGDTSDTE